MERVSTGIIGLDKLIGGGFFKGSTTLIIGPTGSGKSIWSMQFLTVNAIESGDCGIYIPFDETTQNIAQSSSNFGWKINELAEENKVVIYRLKPTDLNNFEPDKIENTLLNKLSSVIKKIKSNRLVLDSMLPIMLRMYHDPRLFYASMHYFTVEIRSLDVTSVLIAPKIEGIFLDVLKTAADNIIELSFEPKGDSYARYFSIKKMKGLECSLAKHAFSIGKNGITVYPKKKVI